MKRLLKLVLAVFALLLGSAAPMAGQTVGQTRTVQRIAYVATGCQWNGCWYTLLKESNASKTTQPFTMLFKTAQGAQWQVRDIFANGDFYDNIGYTETNLLPNTQVSFTITVNLGRQTSSPESGYVIVQIPEQWTGERWMPLVAVQAYYLLKDSRGLVLGSASQEAASAEKAVILDAEMSWNVDSGVALVALTSLAVKVELYDAFSWTVGPDGLRAPVATTTINLAAGQMWVGMMTSELFKGSSYVQNAVNVPGQRGLNQVYARFSTDSAAGFYVAAALRADRATDGSNWLLSGSTAFPAQ
jgi:hypothetical protein